MAIRIRTVDGVRIAVCAVETDPAPGDVYLDDADHEALAAKFAREGLGGTYTEQWRVMDSVKVRTPRRRWRPGWAVGDEMALRSPISTCKGP